MHKHKLIELRKIIEERIGSLSEEVEVATNVKLNPLYIADRKDEIEFVRWTITIIDSILKRDNEHKQIQLGSTKMRLELSDCIEFENALQNRVQELNLKLKESNNLRESDILINEIDTLEESSVRIYILVYSGSCM
jgi:transcriptional regulator of heat shock response